MKIAIIGLKSSMRMPVFVQIAPEVPCGKYTESPPFTVLSFP